MSSAVNSRWHFMGRDGYLDFLRLFREVKLSLIQPNKHGIQASMLG